MPDEAAVDFDGVARDRAERRLAVEELVGQGLIPADVGEAMTSPEAGNWTLFQGFAVVGSLELLRGPADGPVAVPHRLADRELPEHADLGNPWQRLLLYRRLLSGGMAAEQEQLINRGLLQELWPSRLGPPGILQVWEERFPELRPAAER